jgi:hypothetical protein
MVDTQIPGRHIPKGTTVLLLTQGTSIRSLPFYVDEHLRSEIYCVLQRCLSKVLADRGIYIAPAILVPIMIFEAGAAVILISFGFFE